MTPRHVVTLAKRTALLPNNRARGPATHLNRQRWAAPGGNSLPTRDMIPCAGTAEGAGECYVSAAKRHARGTTAKREARQRCSAAGLHTPCRRRRREVGGDHGLGWAPR